MAELKLIYSLCDFSGEWPRPYREAGYRVVQVDLKHGQDVRLLEPPGEPVWGVLAAPPCTDFSSSGAQYWKAKDADGRTLESLALVDACLRFITAVRPHFWALENPVGRLKRWLGKPAYIFDPCDYGDAYTKRTCLWGNFVPPTPLYVGADNAVPPETVCGEGSWLMRLGRKSERTKELRSVTPPGFARAFFLANP